MSTLPHGEWPSPITPEVVVGASVSISEVQVVGDDVFWAEGRPADAGRVQVVRRRADGTTADLLPAGWSARTRVHEYGGGAWLATEDALFVNAWDDQRLYRVDLSPDGSIGEPIAISPAPAEPAGFRHADLDRHGDWIVCIRERHDTGGEAANEIVVLPADGSAAPVVLVSGPDFVANPRLGSDGATLCWIQWNHPDMPWDATELRIGTVDLERAELSDTRLVAGGPGVSVIQPSFASDGSLLFLSDRTGWWNLHRSHPTTPNPTVTALTALDAEIGTPQWVFGMNRYAELSDGRIAFAAASEGVDRLGVLGDGGVHFLDQPYTELSSLRAAGDRVVAVAAGFRSEPVVAAFELDRGTEAILRPARDLPVGDEWFSVAQPVTVPAGVDGARVTHALYYPPTNPEHDGPADAAPPLLVMIHGGPTAMARARLDLGKQYWTSRGFAVVDVNYGGSTGFGRPYRELLKGNWGVVDVEDCIAVATELAARGHADPERLCIRGGSAGGFTVLAVLSSSDVFAAGASSYGVADLTALAADTHKFESRYLDSMVGPYPEAKAVYEERSPINNVDSLRSPLIVFQGLEDEVVPPNQSEMIVDALRTSGVPVAYLAFEGEQHGFRRADTVVTVLGAELAFYGAVLGFTPADDLPELVIENLP